MERTPFCWNIRVYYEDTDAGGIVFYANYLKFFERARTELLRAAGISQHQLTQEEAVMFVVSSTALDYLRPARLDDDLRITVHIRRIGRASVSFFQQAWRSDGNREELLCTGEIRVGCVSIQSMRPAAIPAPVLTALRTHAPLDSATGSGANV